MIDDLFEFLQEGVTPYHAAATAAAWLDAAGFTRLEEADYWNLEPGKGYYLLRNGSAVVAWRIPAHAIGGWRITASHSDAPGWKIKSDAVTNDGCRRLSVEGYGGMNMASWLDRPLTVAGRVLVRTADGVETRLVHFDRDLLVIPSLAIHMQRNVNKGHEYNPQIDMQPLWGPEAGRTLTDLLCEELGVEEGDILDRDLQLVTRQAPTQIGPDGEYFMAPRIDDLECAATTLLGFIDASAETDSACAPVWAMLDNEEVGSSSRQGAQSSFLRDVLDRILESIPHSAQMEHRALANSFLLSADNGHATHPNFPAKSDPAAPVRLGGGVLLKYNASQKYTTNALSGGIFRAICEKAGVKVQTFSNRADEAGRQHAGQSPEPFAAHPHGGHWPAPAGHALRCGDRRGVRRRGHGQGGGGLLPGASAGAGRRRLYAGMTTGRYAPSPSGRMHLGNLLCCLLAWLSAKSQGGQVLLRIEDLDTLRCPRVYADAIIDDLQWLGLAADGPEPPLYQSERSEIYQYYYNKLADRGLVYPCFCSRSQLHAASAPHRSDGQVVYAGTCQHAI